MQWQPSRRRLRFASGATAYLYGGANAEKLRGPEHHFAWADELAKWTDLETAWSNLMLGLRLGQRPRVLATTTPRRSKFLTALIADPATIRTQGRTRGNPHLSESFSAEMQRRFGATRLARQELDGELLVDADGALWTRDTLEAARGPRFVASAGAGLERVVIGVDPPASAGGDACGILVCGLARDGIAYVLEDRTASGLQPEACARRVADAAAKWGAQRIVAEANQGGDMVRAVLRAAGAHLPVALVHATRGKGARAEPVSMAFEQGGARLAGAFPELEDELCALTYAGYQGSGRSPDRADAMVWAMAELLGRGGTPRVRSI
jgi:phage terminase large subunit-like protein